MLLSQAERFLQNNELLRESTKPCKFKIGDLVTFTNDNGVKFENLVVIGFAKPENEVGERFIHISTDSPWFPCKPEELTYQKFGGQKFSVVYPDGKTLEFQKLLDGTYSVQEQ